MGTSVALYLRAPIPLPLFIILSLCWDLFSMSTLLLVTIFQYSTIIAANLKWAASFLVHNSLFQHRQVDLRNVLFADQNYKAAALPGQVSGETAAVGCAVCLCEITVGEEVQELRCDHVFHSDCLDRWVGCQSLHATCPLCRQPLASSPMMVTDLGEETLVFYDFCSFSSGSDRESWWLR